MKQINIRVREEILEQLKLLANNSDRSVQAYILGLIKDAIKNQVEFI